ncbi:7263_t:CDS:2, partial [Cetraspora pellucida]
MASKLLKTEEHEIKKRFLESDEVNKFGKVSTSSTYINSDDYTQKMSESIISEHPESEGLVIMQSLEFDEVNKSNKVNTSSISIINNNNTQENT